MKKFSSLFWIVLSLFTFVSCEKDTVEPTLVGRWKVQKVDYKENGQLSSSYTGQPADFVEFKANGTLDSQVDGTAESLPYTINGNNVTIDGDQFKINELTTTKASLYNENVNLGIRYESYIYLIK